MPEQRKRIRVKTNKRRGKSRVWKNRWIKVHSPAKPPEKSPKEESE